MFEQERVLFAFVQNYAHRLLADLSDDQLRQSVAPGTHTPQWLLGHLACGNAYTLGLLGHAPEVPPAWMGWFGPGSSDGSVPPEAPGKAELLGVFDRTHARILEALPQADPVAMARPHQVPMEFLQQMTPTVGNLVAHLLTTHPATHLGQLSFWRRQMGLPGVLA